MAIPASFCICPPMPAFTETLVWPLLQRHAAALAGRALKNYAADPARHAVLCLEEGDLFLDISRQDVMPETLALFERLLEEQDFSAQRAALFSGEKVNGSESRAALHVALRAFDDTPRWVNGSDVMPGVKRERERALAFAEAVRTGHVKGAGGKTIRTVIHVGIGGSDLGPRLVAAALGDESAPTIHFVRNVDGKALRRVMAACAPEETLVLLASKTFTTAETMRNAETLRAWLVSALGEACMCAHFVALTAAPDKARAFGIADEHIFRFWDWVGGRFSVWSAVGMPAMLALGAERFKEFLRGAAAMDAHFLDAAPACNMPVLLACLDVWHGTVKGHRARAVLPYAEALGEWPGYLQQLEMESLGKSVDRDGRPVAYSTAGVVFGATGTPAQHAFMQALHQGTDVIPADILLVAGACDAHGAMLHANALAQGAALLQGKKDSPEKTCPGSRPTTTLLLKALSPFALGQLVALYEHKVFVEGVLWHINPFDQWGVELGKTLAAPLEKAFLDGHVPESADVASVTLMKRLTNS